MDGEQIINDLIAFLRRHDGIFGTASLRQEPYKGDVFKIFSAAFNSGLITRNIESGPSLSTDGLTDILVERAPDVVNGKTFRTVRCLWEEWTYACEHRELLS